MNKDRVIAAILAFFATLVGIVLIAKGVDLDKNDLPRYILPGAAPSTGSTFSLEISDPNYFWLGGIVLAISLGVLWSLRDSR
jgi:hypothetical protein